VPGGARCTMYEWAEYSGKLRLEVLIVIVNYVIIPYPMVQL
jgi:hypothetical protein